MSRKVSVLPPSLLLLYVWIFCLHVVCTTYACLVPKETEEGGQIPWNLSYRWSCGSWESNPHVLQEQQVLLKTAETSFQNPDLQSITLIKDKLCVILKWLKTLSVWGLSLEKVNYSTEPVSIYNIKGNTRNLGK